jgi:hypothetical protein
MELIDVCGDRNWPAVLVRRELVLTRWRKEPFTEWYERYECETVVGDGPTPGSGLLRWIMILAWLTCEPQGCRTRDAL